MTTRSRKTNTANTALRLAIVASETKQRVVAARTRIGEVRLSYIVTGRAEATPAEKKALARVLNVDVATIFPDLTVSHS